MLVDAQEDAVVIAHLIRGEWVAACDAHGQHIPFRTLKQLLVQSCEGQRREKSPLLTEGADLRVHVLGQQQLFHFGDFPLKILYCVGGDRDQ